MHDQQANRSDSTPAAAARSVSVLGPSAVGVTQVTAAQILGVSPSTVSRMVARGQLQTFTPEGASRSLVNLQQVAALAAELRRLRALADQPGPLAAAIAAIEQSDERYQAEFAELYGDQLAAAEHGQLIPLTIPDSFGPED